jgi:hypothetical protein
VACADRRWAQEAQIGVPESRAPLFPLHSEEMGLEIATCHGYFGDPADSESSVVLRPSLTRGLPFRLRVTFRVYPDRPSANIAQESAAVPETEVTKATYDG